MKFFFFEFEEIKTKKNNQKKKKRLGLENVDGKVATEYHALELASYEMTRADCVIEGWYLKPNLRFDLINNMN